MRSVLLTAVVALATTNARAGDAPEISRSRGPEGGVVVLWPRIIPRAASPQSTGLAATVQRHLEAIVRRTLPGKPVDRRPAPERVCPQAGCMAMSVGALLARRGGGCVLVGLVSRRHKAPAALIPWVGKVKLKQANAPFRDQPESYVTIVDFEPCDQVEAKLASGDDRLSAAIRATFDAR